jgi:site-specific recombinase XerC
VAVRSNSGARSTQPKEGFMQSVLLDAGHRRSPATMPGYHRGRPPRNTGEHYPADPPTVEEIVAVMRTVGDHPHGERLRALIVLLWRAGLRISEALGRWSFDPLASSRSGQTLEDRVRDRVRDQHDRADQGRH